MEDYSQLYQSHNDYFLFGNGLSIGFCESFKYSSLYKVCSGEEDGFDAIFSDKEIELFNGFRTENFEWVLYALNLAEDVNAIVEVDGKPIREHYNNIKQALLKAVHKVHIKYEDTDFEEIELLNNLFKKFNKGIFTTNYDLIPYWTLNHNTDGLCDVFFGSNSTFDVTNTEVRDYNTPIYFLHGALHLYREDGVTIKLRRNQGTDLLTRIEQTMTESKTPLFVSEGRNEQKLKSIASNDYLNHCYNQLKNASGGITIFGSRLGSEDKHIIEAIKHSNIRNIAYSIYMNNDEVTREIEVTVAKIRREFAHKNVKFFKHGSFLDYFKKEIQVNQ
ncbi:DUF4917 family protein [Bacillus sp. CHD6a]|uniref:DUF4917 family protein n=1 Tax=Bacillus sp. CHD6a TaxID=1643452 RepID=UPI0006CC50C4|nr:DUF4917 family protein [Bacillus sp. CHD6a]KPB03446.1 hypothetical protein AAV98_17250 [Bacillus sp. CHD6a]